MDFALRLVFWESTARCNLACIHCRRLDTAEGAARDDLSTDEALGLIESAASIGRPIFVFSGGEPLMRDDWRRLADHARSLGLPTALATNATLIDVPLAGQIAGAAFRRVSVSLDGADASTHDGFRGVPGCFDLAIGGIAALRGAGVPVQINTTISSHNIDQLDAVYQLAADLGAVALHLFLLVPVGCGAQLAQTHQLSPAAYERVLHWVCDRQESGEHLELKATCAPEYYRVAARRGLDVGHSRGCLAGLSVVFVSHKGEVFPCGYLPVACGNIRERPLEEIWRDSPVLADLRDFSLLEGRCGACGYKGICGGCRARAYAATGNYQAADPACAYTPPAPGPR